MGKYETTKMNDKEFAVKNLAGKKNKDDRGTDVFGPKEKIREKKDLKTKKSVKGDGKTKTEGKDRIKTKSEGKSINTEENYIDNREKVNLQKRTENRSQNKDSPVNKSKKMDSIQNKDKVSIRNKSVTDHNNDEDKRKKIEKS